MLAVSFGAVLLSGGEVLRVEVWENGGARALGGPGLGPAGTPTPPSLYARGLAGRPASLGATPGFGLLGFIFPVANAACWLSSSSKRVSPLAGRWLHLSGFGYSPVEPSGISRATLCCEDWVRGDVSQSESELMANPIRSWRLEWLI